MNSESELLNKEGRLMSEKKSVPEPPPPKISIRTMKSDIEALEISGGEPASPEPFIYQPEGEIRKTKISEEKKVEIDLSGIPGYTGPEKAIFSSPADSAGREAESEPAAKTPENKTPEIKIILAVAAIITAGILFWILGYFVVYPWLFPRQN